jgi:hypothetical protein
MLDVFNIAKPQGCDIQTFYGSGGSAASARYQNWVKPRGVSNIYMLLIGAGGNGDGATGGGSGVVTVWYGSAQNVPDRLVVQTGIGIQSQILGSFSSGTLVLLLNAPGGNGTLGGSAQTAGPFGNMGFYQSIAGQNGTSGTITASSTTFLSGGGGNTDPQASNYGYTTGRPFNANGFFMLQPIIVGACGMGSGTGGIGCGGGVTNGSGGPGMVLIASW